MKIGAVSVVFPTIKEKSAVGLSSDLSQKNNSARFGFVNLLKGDHQQALIAMERGVIEGRRFTANELLLYQIRAGQLQLKVELCAKLADSCVATVKRFQAGQ